MSDDEMPEGMAETIADARETVSVPPSSFMAHSLRTRALAWLADRLDRLIRERDEAMQQRALANADRDQTLRDRAILINLRRNQLAVNAVLQRQCDSMTTLVNEVIGWDEEAVDGAQLAHAIALYRARAEKEGTNG